MSHTEPSRAGARAPSEAHWSAFRSRIPATSHCIYFNSGWSGPLPSPVVEAVEGRLRREWREGPTAQAVQDELLALRERVRAQFAALIHAEAESVVLTQNTTEGMNIVISGLEWRAGDVVVTTTMEHSTGLVPVYYLAARHGVEARYVSPDVSEASADTLQRFYEAITPGVKLVVISHISYSTGLVLPLAEIVQRAHEVGARVLVDGAQSMGQLPLDLSGWEVDYYAVPAHKWLLGPDGVGALYVRRDLISSLEPRAVAGKAARSFAFDGSGFEPQRDDIAKFQLTTSSGPLLAGVEAALAFYAEAGPAAARNRIRSLGAAAADALGAVAGVTVVGPRRSETRSGLVCFRVADRECRSVAEALQRDHGIVCRAVAEQNTVRWSMHYFNTEEEVRSAVAALTALVAASDS